MVATELDHVMSLRTPRATAYSHILKHISFSLIMFVCLYACRLMHEHVHTHLYGVAHEGQNKVSDPLDLELQVL